MGRIVFIVKSLASKHGVERTLTDKANYLAEHGHAVAVLTYEQGEHPIAFPLHASIQHVDMDCRFFTLFRWPLHKRLWKLRKMRRLLQRRLHGFVDTFRPDVIVTTTYSCICMDAVMTLRSKAPVIVESHSVLDYELPTDTLLHRLRRFSCLRTLRKCDLLIALTEGDAACWRKYVSQVVVIPNPVSFYCEDVGLCRRRKGRIISVGRLQEPKRFDVLIDAFAMIADQYPDWYVDVYGDGEYRDDLERRIQAKGLKDRFFLRQPTAAVMEEYMSSQLFVLCSDFEGFGLVLVEAMACGLPVVSTNCPYGPSEIVENGVTGLLADMNSRDLAAKMSRLLSDDCLRETMGHAAHQAAARYRQSVVMSEWEKAYVSIA